MGSPNALAFRGHSSRRCWPPLMTVGGSLGERLLACALELAETIYAIVKITPSVLRCHPAASAWQSHSVSTLVATEADRAERNAR